MHYSECLLHTWPGWCEQGDLSAGTSLLGSPSFSISGLQSSNTFMLLSQLLLQQKKKHWFYQIIFTKTSEIHISVPLSTTSHPSPTGHTCIFTRGQCFPGGSVVKNLPAKQEMQVRSLDPEDPLEKEMATHSNILPGKSHEQRKLADYNPWGNKELDTTWWLNDNSNAWGFPGGPGAKTPRSQCRRPGSHSWSGN